MSNDYRFRRKRSRHDAEEPAARRHDFQAEQGEAEADAVSDEIVRAAGPDSERQMAALSTADGPTRARVIQRLQAEHGNQYVQRLMVQRQTRGGAASVFDTAHMRDAAANVLDKEQSPAREWLEANTASLNALSVAEIILLIRRNVPAAAQLADAEIETVIREWAAVKHVTLTTTPAPSQRPAFSIADSQMVSNVSSVVQGAFHIATQGINIVEANKGRINISVSGATVDLNPGNKDAGEKGNSGVAVSGTVGWTGTVGVATAYQGWHFTGTLAADRWELGLSFPGDSAVPDLNRLSRVFSDGETAMRGMADAVTNAGGIRGAQEGISSHLQPVKDAVHALSDIGSAPAGVSVGVSLSGPSGREDAAHPPGGADEGIELRATLTVRF